MPESLNATDEDNAKTMERFREVLGDFFTKKLYGDKDWVSSILTLWHKTVEFDHCQRLIRFLYFESGLFLHMLARWSPLVQLSPITSPFVFHHSTLLCCLLHAIVFPFGESASASILPSFPFHC
jgi:hypothetical protein